jgi:hypothetical protein
MMPAIFSNAEDVRIWLGSATATSDKALSFVPKILDLKLIDTLASDDSAIDEWYAFGELMRNRWFSRRWVLQEVVLARSATLHCGTMAINWPDFAAAVALFNAKLDQIKELFRFSRKYAHIPDVFSDRHSVEAKTFVDATSSLVRRSSEGEVVALRCSIEALVSNLFAFEATNARDTVYALLPLAKDASNITIDYNQSPTEVFTGFISSCVRSSGSLDIICRHWAPAGLRHPALPSWILSTSGSPYGASSDAFMGRVNGDSFVGSPGKQLYNAASGFGPVSVRFGSAQAETEEGTYHSLMLAKGIKIDTISELGARSIQGVIYRESLEMGGLDDRRDGSRVPEVLWRTLVADRGADGKDPPIWYRQAFRHCLSQRTTEGDIMTNELAERSPRLVIKFLQRVQAVIWNRKFFRTNKRSLFGLAPSQARYGDIICILFGCSVPVVLREHRDTVFRRSPSIDYPYYEFIGECYVHGMMDGEAKTMVDCEPEDFKLK